MIASILPSGLGILVSSRGRCGFPTAQKTWHRHYTAKNSTGHYENPVGRRGSDACQFAVAKRNQKGAGCGRKLRWIKRTFTQGPRGVLIPVGERPNLYAKAGDYGDGFFCGLRCGYQFGVLVANHGNRFTVKGAYTV